MIYLINTLDPTLQTGGNTFNDEFVCKLRHGGKEVVYLAGRPIAELLQYVPRGSTIIIDSICLSDWTYDWSALSAHKTLVLLHMAPTENSTLSDVERRELMKIEKFVFSNYPILALGYASLWYIERSYKFQARHILIKNFIKLDFEKTIYCEFPTKFLAVGSICKDKGTDILIRSLSALGDKRWTLDIYGAVQDRNFFDECIALAHALQLNHLITFRGLVSKEELHQKYCLYDLLIHTSLHENSSIAIRDAILIGLPFVTTPTGDFYKYIEINAGMVSSDFSHDEVAKTIQTSINHYPSFVDRSKAARDTFRKEAESFTFNEMFNLL